MAGLVLTNNAFSTLAAGIGAGATSLTVQGGDGALFPATGAGDYFPLTLTDAAGNMEIVKCTARSGDAFTIVRAQEGTSALTWSSNDSVSLRLTAATILSFFHPDYDGSGSGLDADLLDGMQPASANTASTVVNRDGSGNFAAGTITAALSGNATSATNQSGGTVAATTMTASGAVTLSSTLQVDGNATIGNAAGDVHTFNGNTTFNHNLTVSGDTDCQAITATDLAISGAGSAADCAISINNDVGVGLFAPGADQIGFATGGTERLRIDNDGTLQHEMSGSLYDAFFLRGFVNFDGSGVVSENSTGNCSSISDIGIGRFTYNFATNMPDTNYGMIFGCVGAYPYPFTICLEDSTKAITDFDMFCYRHFGSTLTDPSDATVAIVR